MNVANDKLLSSGFIAELEEVLRDPYSPPERKAMAKACKQIDRMREETRKRMGEMEVAVGLVRA